MKTRILLAMIAVLSFVAAGVLLMRSSGKSTQREPATASESHSEASHSHVARVPAFQQVSEIGNLAPTLPANKFIGKSREAYIVAKEIPATLAQLPCYCECDKAFGHKSLHSCFVDDHASQCAVCVDEALLAYKLQKEEKLTPEQVRDRIIAQYSSKTP
ncbi:MAG TPA: CYCXC family (seleno)protein [Pyrinomonadaceae bacterium]|nr:CYCXC family (seleno)protein [Pyrinomonadaceae bacterium]